MKLATVERTFSLHLIKSIGVRALHIPLHLATAIYNTYPFCIRIPRGMTLEFLKIL